MEKGVSIEKINSKKKKNGQYGKPILSGIFRAILVCLLVLIQIVFVVCISLELAKYTVYVYAIVEIASFFLVMYLMDERYSMSYKLSWFTIILLLPVTGHIIFLLWGGRSRNTKEDRKIVEKINNSYKYNKEDKSVKEAFYKEYPNLKKPSDFLSNENFPIYKNNDITYYPMGDKAFEAIIDEIKRAEKFVLIEFFIVAEGKLWNKLHEV